MLSLITNMAVSRIWNGREIKFSLDKELEPTRCHNNRQFILD